MIHAVLLITLFTTGIDSLSAKPFVSGYSGPRLAAKQGMSLEQAVAEVKRETNGRILTAETIKRNGHPLHRIKVLLPNGKVRVMHIDAE
jgi:hypothetical protein